MKSSELAKEQMREMLYSVCLSHRDLIQAAAFTSQEQREEARREMDEWKNKMRSLIESRVPAEKEGGEKSLRRMLWFRHGCPSSGLYGDDGEMQCHSCGMDFKRDAPATIETRFREIGMRKLKASIDAGWHWDERGCFVPPAPSPGPSAEGPRGVFRPASSSAKGYPESVKRVLSPAPLPAEVEEAMGILTQTGAIYLIATYKEGKRGQYNDKQVTSALAVIRAALKLKERV